MMGGEDHEKSVWGRAVVYLVFYGAAAVLAVWTFVSIVLQVFWPERFPPP